MMITYITCHELNDHSKKDTTVMLYCKIQETSKKNFNKIYLFRFTINGNQNNSLISQWWVGRAPNFS